VLQPRHLRHFTFAESVKIARNGKCKGTAKPIAVPSLDNGPRCRQTPAQGPQRLEAPKEPEEKMEVQEAEGGEEEMEADT